MERAAEEAGVEITTVADTHVHNDYVSDALGLARRHGADYLLAADEPVDFERVGVRHGDVVAVGSLEVEVLATPGHTRHHQSFYVRSAGAAGGPALFSGGSLLHGTVGRTDLVDPRLARQLACAQWDSARSLGTLDPATDLHPTHGFGSFCAARVGGSPTGPVSLADELRGNPVLTTPHHLKEQFVSDLVDGYGPVPAYYPRMAPLNRSGAGSAAVRPARPVTAEQVSDAVLAGSWVVDLRSRSALAEDHVPGSVSVEYSDQFATYVGWLVPWADDIVLLTDTLDMLEPALRDLANLGIDHVGAYVLTECEPLTASYRRTSWEGYRRALADQPFGLQPLVVDVRQRDEWDAGHLPGALNLPVQDVEEQGRRLPPGELWLHCRSGYRAGIAASLLHRSGRSVVHVDDSWDRVSELAIATVRPAA